MPVIIKKRFFIPLEAKDQRCFKVASGNLSLTGFTLVEIIVATIIFSLVILGMLSVFLAGNKHIIHTRERMSSAELGKLFLDPLQMDVRQDTWNQAGNDLRLSATPVALTPQNVNNRNFSAAYTTTAVGGTDLRRVTTTITWTEPSS